MSSLCSRFARLQLLRGALLRLAVLAFAVVCLVLPGGARGETGATLLARGLQQFNDGALKSAERVLAEAVAVLPAGPERARAHLHQGLCLAYRGQQAAAKRTFIRALADDVSVDFNRERVPPAVSTLFEEARAAATGVLRIEGGSPGTLLEVGERALGLLPQELRLRVGPHRVRAVDASGRVLYDVEHQLRAGDRQVVRIVAPGDFTARRVVAPPPVVKAAEAVQLPKRVAPPATVAPAVREAPRFRLALGVGTSLGTAAGESDTSRTPVGRGFVMAPLHGALEVLFALRPWLEVGLELRIQAMPGPTFGVEPRLRFVASEGSVRPYFQLGVPIMQFRSGTGVPGYTGLLELTGENETLTTGTIGASLGAGVVFVPAEHFAFSVGVNLLALFPDFTFFADIGVRVGVRF